MNLHTCALHPPQEQVAVGSAVFFRSACRDRDACIATSIKEAFSRTEKQWPAHGVFPLYYGVAPWGVGEEAGTAVDFRFPEIVIECLSRFRFFQLFCVILCRLASWLRMFELFCVCVHARSLISCVTTSNSSISALASLQSCPGFAFPSLCVPKCCINSLVCFANDFIRFSRRAWVSTDMAEVCQSLSIDRHRHEYLPSRVSFHYS